MRAANGSIRTVEVRPPSDSDEAGAVFLAAVFVVLCVIYVIAFEVHEAPAERGQRGLLAHQVLFSDLAPPDQRTFRQMREGFDEALRAFGRSGAWPATERLAADGVPPFVADPLDPGALRWHLQQDERGASYVGLPTAPGGGTAFQVRIQSPDPSAIERLGPTTALDEEHRALPDGTLLHVTYWRRDRPPRDDAVGPDPAREGWTQIRLKTLFDEESR